MPRDNLAAQVDSDLLTAVQTLAQKEGRQLQALVEEALTDLIEKHQAAWAAAARHRVVSR